jgi:hypothetical protein
MNLQYNTEINYENKTNPLFEAEQILLYLLILLSWQ